MSTLGYRAEDAKWRQRETTTKIPTPGWIATAIVGFEGGCSDPTPAFVNAAADRVWQTIVAFAELQQRDAGDPLTLRLVPDPVVLASRDPQDDEQGT